MAAAMTQAGTAMAALRRTASAEDAANALEAFTNLRAVTVQHLDHEEAEIEPVYLEKFDTPELQEMAKKFSRDSGPKQAGTFFAWLLDGASEAEEAVAAPYSPRTRPARSSPASSDAGTARTSRRSGRPDLRSGGGRWPSGSARGGWRAAACAARSTRGSRPS